MFEGKTLDAYVFAAVATQSAIDAAVAAVGTGTARAALPLMGARRLYVAVSDDDPATLFQKVAAITSIVGLAGVTTHLTPEATGNEATPYPTHGAVGNYVGFSLVATIPGQTMSVYTEIQGITGVIGVTMVTGEAFSVLVEVTGNDNATVASIHHEIEMTPGVARAPDATGLTSLGAGFTTA